MTIDDFNNINSFYEIYKLAKDVGFGIRIYSLEDMRAYINEKIKSFDGDWEDLYLYLEDAYNAVTEDEHCIWFFRDDSSPFWYSADECDLQDTTKRLRGFMDYNNMFDDERKMRTPLEDCRMCFVDI